MVQSISYETLQTISLVCFIAAGILLIASIPIWLTAFGGVDGIRSKLKKQGSGSSSRTPVLDPDTVADSSGPGLRQEVPFISEDEGSAATQMLDKNKDRETEILKNPRPTEKFCVTREITITHTQEATSDS